MKNRITHMSIRKKFILFSTLTIIFLVLIELFYYIRISTTTEKLVDQYSSGIVQQVNRTIGEIFNEAQSVGFYLSRGELIEDYLKPKDDYVLYTKHKYLVDKIQTAAKTNNNIYDIIIYRSDGRLRYQYNSANNDVSDLLNQYASRFENGVSPAEFTHLKNAENDLNLTAYIQPVIYSTRSTFWKQQVGTIVVILDKEILHNILKNISINDNSTFYLLDQQNEIISSTGSQSDKISDIMDNPNVITQEINDTGWKIVCDIDTKSAVQRYSFFQSLALIIAVSIAVLITILLRIFNSSIVNPISNLCRQIDKITCGGLKKRINMDKDDEIGKISQTINHMLDHQTEISYHMLETQQNLYEAELAKKESELRALENQINPHFLLNTLQCICGVAIANDVPMIIEIASNMSAIFTYSLRGKENVTLREELEIVQSYLKIVDARFNKSFQWHIDVAPEHLNQQMTKMILQPLVENAVYHGLEKHGKGNLSICTKIQNDLLIIQIQDDGVGIEAEKVQNLNCILKNKTLLHEESMKNKKIGIANTCWRIKTVFGDDYGIELFSDKGQGCLIQINLPYKITDDLNEPGT